MTPEEIAAHLLVARAGGPKLEPDEAGWSTASLAEAYDVQARVAATVGAVGGFKTGRRADGTQIGAPIFQKDIFSSGASFSPLELHRIGIELEVGFLVTDLLPEPDDPSFLEAARSCVAAVAAIEIVDTRLTDIKSAPPSLRLADNQMNGKLLVGEPRQDWGCLDLSHVRAKLTVGSDTVLDGVVAVPGGNAFEAFCSLARAIGDHCGGLRPGHFIITGSLNGLPFIEGGMSVEGSIHGLGDVTGNFSRADR